MQWITSCVKDDGCIQLGDYVEAVYNVLFFIRISKIMNKYNNNLVVRIYIGLSRHMFNNIRAWKGEKVIEG